MSPPSADDDGVLVEDLVHLVGEAQGIDRHGVAGALGHHLVALGGLGFAQGLQERREVDRLALCRLHHLLHHEAGVADDADVDGAVGADLAAVHVDLDDLELLAEGRAASVTEAEIERRAEDHHRVSLTQRVAARTAQEVRIVGAHASATLTV